MIYLGFSKIVILFTSILKIIISSQILVANKIFAANKVGGIKDGHESIEKYRKLLKTRKLFKFQKSIKLKKKLVKNGNLSNFNAKKNGQSFLIPKTKAVFNHL